MAVLEDSKLERERETHGDTMDGWKRVAERDLCILFGLCVKRDIGCAFV